MPAASEAIARTGRCTWGRWPKKHALGIGHFRVDTPGRTEAGELEGTSIVYNAEQRVEALLWKSARWSSTLLPVASGGSAPERALDDGTVIASSTWMPVGAGVGLIAAVFLLWPVVGQESAGNNRCM